MIARSTNITCIAVGLLAVTACSPAPVATPETASAEAEVVPAVSTVPETAEAPEEQFLVYEWDTEFSAFLSPPIEVRRMAREDCVKAGYEVAVVETLALEGNVARAIYICRGDFE